MRYTSDGGVIPSGLPVAERGTSEHDRLFGLFRGIVIRTIYPDDRNSSNRERVEYVVRVRGQEYPNAINLREAGGIYNYQERIRKETEKSFTGRLDGRQYDNNMDGEVVFVLFIEGNGNTPIIVGSEQHPRHPAYKKPNSAQGRFDVEEFNGVEFLIDKDSNYSVRHVGRKDRNGAILNPAAVNSFVTMFGNGDIELNTHGTSGTSDLRARMTKASKTLEVYAQDNKVVMDSSGIIVHDKNGNKFTQDSSGETLFDKNGNKVTQSAAGTKIEDNNGNVIEMKGGQVHITVSGAAQIDVSGSASVTAGGAATVTAQGATINSPNITMNAPAGVSVNTPLMNVSGLLSCAGIGAGAAPVAGEGNFAGTMKANEVKSTGNVTAGGDVKDTKGTMQEIRTIYDGHTHPSPMGDTGAPTAQM